MTKRPKDFFHVTLVLLNTLGSVGLCLEMFWQLAPTNTTTAQQLIWAHSILVTLFFVVGCYRGVVMFISLYGHMFGYVLGR